MSVYTHIKRILATAAEVDVSGVNLERPGLDTHGDFSTNIALRSENPMQTAKKIADAIGSDEIIERVEVASPGFVNIWLKSDCLVTGLDNLLKNVLENMDIPLNHGKNVIVEYAHPNTHKEMHIGHMRTLILGESLARILKVLGTNVFRANYQGDIGPHVAKAIWGTQKILKEQNKTIEEADREDIYYKAHLLGLGYVEGSRAYEESEKDKEEIVKLNKSIYTKDSEYMRIYNMTRTWSLDYYDAFYRRFDTSFDKLYFESDVAENGKSTVLENVGKGVFKQSEGAIVFDGERYGLHTRVFVTADGNPTYEGKEMGLAYAQKADFEFDKCIHVVANEQKGYFEVVIKAIEEVDKWFLNREFHLSMGMVNLVGKKISSRKGDVYTVDSFLNDVKEEVKQTFVLDNNEKALDKDILESLTLGAVKYSVLKTNPGQNVEFDIKKSVSLQGNSGPYIQYTYARTQSLISKSGLNLEQMDIKKIWEEVGMNEEELKIARYILRLEEVIWEAGNRLCPNLICEYLYELSQRFNSFYNQHSVLSADNENKIKFRVALTAAVGNAIKHGLYLLGIKAPERI